MPLCTTLWPSSAPSNAPMNMPEGCNNAWANCCCCMCILSGCRCPPPKGIKTPFSAVTLSTNALIQQAPRANHEQGSIRTAAQGQRKSSPWRPQPLMRLSRSMACPQRLALLLVLTAAVACDASAARLLPPGGGGARTPAAVSSRTLQTEQAPFAAAQAERVDSVHQPLRSTPRTWTALALSLVVAALSNAAGVGGGAIFVLLFVALLDLPVKEATALSQAVITAAPWARWLTASPGDTPATAAAR